MRTTEIQTELRYIPISEELAAEVRSTRRDRHGHEVEIVETNGPCRSCLRYSEVDEPFILMSYQPLPDRNPYAEIGPVFIHAAPCAPYSEVTVFPETFAGRPLILRAYDIKGFITGADVAAAGDAPRLAARFLQDANVAEVHVRHVSYTCYDFKIVRA